MPFSATDIIDSPCHCAVLRKATRQLSQAYDTALAPTGLKITQLSLLATIQRAKKNPSLKDLAEMMVMDRSTLGQNLRPLEREGLICLESDRHDARSRHVILTKKGLAKLDQALKLWREMQTRFESTLGSRKLSKLRRTLLGIATTDFS